MCLYRKELAETLEEWDEKGRAPGNICGLIEGSHVEHDMTKIKKVGAARRAAEKRDRSPR